MKRPKTGEVLYARVPPGTKARIEAVRGLERESDWLRRLVMEVLEAAEARSEPPANRTRRPVKPGGA
jgi:hypothetical protein